MDHIKELNLTSVAYKAEETKKMFFCACKQTNKVSLFVMVHTTKSNIEIKNILTTFSL